MPLKCCVANCSTNYLTDKKKCAVYRLPAFLFDYLLFQETTFLIANTLLYVLNIGL